MKLNSLLPNVAKLPILLPGPTLPNGTKTYVDPTGITLMLTGQDTKTFRDKAKAIAKGLVGKTSKDVDLDAMEKQNLELAATCIVGWTGLEDDNGAEIAYSPEKALELMTIPGLSFLKEQVEEFIAERKNFFRQPGEAA